MRSIPNLNITVVDLDETALQTAKELGLNVLRSSALNLPVKDNCVDIVLCLDLIEHIHEGYKLPKEISRVLRDKGKVILTTPMQNGVSFPFLRKDRIEKIEKEWGHVRKGYSLEEIVHLFKKNDLVVEKTNRYFNFFSRCAYLGYLLKAPVRITNLLYRNIIRLEPFIKYQAEEHIIIGRKVKP